MITFICFDLNLPSFGPLGGLKKALDPNFSREVAPFDVVPLDTQSGGRGEPTAKRSSTGSPPVCPKVRHRAFRANHPNRFPYTKISLVEVISRRACC
jgi:hypothetical protein